MGNHLRVAASNGEIIEKSLLAQEQDSVTTRPYRRWIVSTLLLVPKLSLKLAIFALLGIRYALFFVLYWLRILIYPVMSLVCGLTLLAALLMLLNTSYEPRLFVAARLGGFSFGCFLFVWFYDGLLLVLSPRSIIIDDGRDNDH